MRNFIINGANIAVNIIYENVYFFLAKSGAVQREEIISPNNIVYDDMNDHVLIINIDVP